MGGFLGGQRVSWPPSQIIRGGGAGPHLFLRLCYMYMVPVAASNSFVLLSFPANIAMTILDRKNVYF